MQKIVINKCYGGFNVSHEAILRYAEIKGITLYPESIDSAFGGYVYYTVPKDQRITEVSTQDWYNMPQDDRIAYNEAYRQQTLSDHEFARDDPALVQAVEELGAKANGPCANLAIIETPDGVSWQVEEYDGKEWVAEVHRTWS